MLRPKSIRWFDRLYFASLAPSLVETTIYILTSPLVSGNHQTTMLTRIIILIIVYCISLLNWFYIALRGRPAAKWFWVGMVLLGLILLPSTVERRHHEMLTALRLTMDATGWLLSIAATVMLFRPDAKAWFANRGR